MEKRSTRSQTFEQFRERRKQAVRLYKKGIKVVRMKGLSYATVVRPSVDLYEAGGWSAVSPALRGRARVERAEIHWADETALVNTDVGGRSLAAAGKTPVAVAVGGTRQKLSVIATVTNQVKACWMIIG